MPDTHRTPLDRPGMNGSQHTKSFLRQIGRRWTPADADEAKEFAVECLLRAEQLADVLADYAMENRTPIEQFREVFELVDDLIYLGYGMIEFWPTADASYTPPA